MVNDTVQKVGGECMGACGVQMKAIRCKAITTLPENVEIVNEVDVVGTAGGLEPGV